MHVCDTLLLADVFERIRNKCFEIYELHPAYFLSVPGLVWQACLKKIGIKLELLIDVDTLLMVEKGIRGGICHVMHRYAKINNKYMENCKESYIQYLDASNLYGWVISQKLPVNGFEWVKDISSINKKIKKIIKLVKTIMKIVKGNIIEVDVDYPKKLHDLHSDLPFLPERMNINKCNELLCNLYDKKSMLST